MSLCINSCKIRKKDIQFDLDPIQDTSNLGFVHNRKIYLQDQGATDFGPNTSGSWIMIR